MASQPRRCSKMCCPDGREGIAIMHGGNPISESYDADGEY